jgi:hypothetical protein
VVVVEADVWARWSALEAQGQAREIALLLRSRTPKAKALQAVEEAASEAIRRLWSDEAVAGQDRGWRTGRWRAMPVLGGVLLHIDEEPDDFRGLVGLIVEGLQVRGVSGRLELFEATRPAEVPRSMPLIEARLRVVGERVDRLDRGNMWWWNPDRGALRNVVIAAAQWCAAYGGPLGLSSEVGLLPRVAVGSGAELVEHLDGAIHAVGLNNFDLVSLGVSGLRMVSVTPNSGRVSLVWGDQQLLPDRWPAAVADLAQFMTTHAGQLVYGLVKHGSGVKRIALDQSLDFGWPARREFTLPIMREGAYEDRYAPDAFAVQLLGTGYAGRIPATQRWTAERVGADGAVLLRHNEPDAWFRLSLTEFAEYRKSRHVDAAPDVIAQAREDFAANDILFRDEYARFDHIRSLG